MVTRKTLLATLAVALALVVAVGAAFAVGTNGSSSVEDSEASERNVENVEAEAPENDVQNAEDQLGDLEARIGTAGLISALNYINAAGFHDMDEELSEEGEINPRYLSTVQGVIAVTDATTWPADLESDVADLRYDLDALAEALGNEDVEAAAEASHGIHGTQHSLSNAVIAYLAGEEANHAEEDGDGDEASSHDEAAEEADDDNHGDEAHDRDSAEENAATLGITDWEFDGDVHVNEGTVSLTVVNDGDMPHGVHIPEMGVNESVAAGETKTISFEATEHGEYTIYCNDPMCGTAEQHGNMMANLIVE